LKHFKRVAKTEAAVSGLECYIDLVGAPVSAFQTSGNHPPSTTI